MDLFGKTSGSNTRNFLVEIVESSNSSINVKQAIIYNLSSPINLANINFRNFLLKWGKWSSFTKYLESRIACTVSQKGSFPIWLQNHNTQAWRKGLQSQLHP